MNIFRHIIIFSLVSLSVNPTFVRAAEVSDSELTKTALALFGVIPAKEETPDKVTQVQIELGRKLFFDYRLSRDGSTACVRCHQPQFYSTDRLPQSMGFNNNKGARNAQSILNLKYQTVVHWRGDRESLEEQALRAFTVPLSLGNLSEEEALKRLAAADYGPLFEKAFPKVKKPLSLGNAAAALASYQRSLSTPSPFDKYLQGEPTAISGEAQKGLKEFINVGCVSCHNGPAVGGRSMQKFGVFKDYWTLTKSAIQDKGRYDVTKNDADMYVFKVPSLRNIAQTAPYFHDGSAQDLETAIRWMAKLQLNKDLSKKQVQQIKAFLESLTGELPPHFREAPLMTVSPLATGL